jgi:hypothetical protein
MPRRIILKVNGLTGTLPSGVKGFGLDYLGRASLLENGTITPISESQSFYLALNFVDLEQFIYVAPEDFKINSITNPSSLLVTITLNDVPYTLGESINEFDIIKVNVDSIGFIKLNCDII